MRSRSPPQGGGLGAAAGPLIGGLVTSAISWRASFGLQVLVVAWIILLARKITDPARTGRKPHFDLTGAVLSAAGLFFVVLGLLQSRTYGFLISRQAFTIGNTVILPKGSVSPVWIFVAIGALFLLWFFLHVRSGERQGRDVLLPLRLFRDKTANLGLGTQTIQWLTLQGSFFVVSVYLQEVNGYNAIETGLLLTPATIGILAASAGADRFARRHPQRWLIIAGFMATALGMILLLTLVRAHAGIWRWIPGLFLFGAGVGVMLTSSVNVVQSSFPDTDQGDISGHPAASPTSDPHSAPPWSAPSWSPPNSPQANPSPSPSPPCSSSPWSAWSSLSSSRAGQPSPQSPQIPAWRRRHGHQHPDVSAGGQFGIPFAWLRREGGRAA